jgi:hypothetical protein
MVIVGLAFLITWLFMILFAIEVSKAILVTAILFIVVGLLLGERPWERR